MKLKWAFNSATVMKLPWDDEFALWRKFKWQAVELWFDKIAACREKGRKVEELARQLSDAGIEPIGMAPSVIWTPSEGRDARAECVELAERMDVTAAIGAPALTVVVLGNRGNDLAAEYDRLVVKLHDVAEMARVRGIRINLEFIAGQAVNGTLGTAIDLVRRTGHPNLGLLLDLCHYYTSASHIEELGLLPRGKLFLVHVDDAQPRPMEALWCEHRCFPGEGRIDVPALIAEILERTRYNGYFSLELYDKTVWEMDPAEVFQRARDSLRKVQRKLKA